MKRTIRFFTFLTLLALAFGALGITPAQAAPGDYAWAKGMGGTLTDYGRAIAVDGSGNVYTAGYFYGTADFDPGAGTFNLTPAGGYEIFVSKLDASGNFVWAKQLGGTSNDYGRAIAVDGSGNVYITGYFEGTADFDPGAGTFNLTSAGNQDIFISKLDSNGDFVWAKQLGGTSNDYGYGIAVDGSGNVYTTGWFQGTADFDPGAGTFSLTSAGNPDIFVSKLDSSGNFVWAKAMGGTSVDIGMGIAVDGSGNVYTTGYFYGTVDFDPGAGTFNLTPAGGYEIFVSKLASNGDFAWAKAMGGTFDDDGYSIYVDGSGNVYTTGEFYGTADFDPGAGTANLTSAGNQDIFVSKLDASGNFVWAKQLGGTSIDYGRAIAVNGNGNVYTTGYFQGTADFDPGAGTFNLTSAESQDIFVSKLDSSGNFVWAKGMGGIFDDIGYSIAVDGSGNVYTTGYFQSTADFDPGAGTANLTSAGTADIFVSKLLGSSTVTFDANEGSGSMTPQVSSVPAALTLNAFTRTGYTFAGWGAAAGSPVVYADGATYDFSADITLYAQWAPSCLVTTNTDSGTSSLRWAIANCPSGGTITFDGDYTIPLASQLTIDKNLTIDGETHNVTVSGGDSVSVFQVNSGVTATLNSLTITNGNAVNGGGIQNAGMLTVTNSTISNNHASWGGGGIYNNAGVTLTLTNTTLTGNTSGNYGGGIYNDGGLTITSSTFSSNSATYGGGVYNGNSMGITSSTLSDNSTAAANGQGGGIYNTGTLTVTDCTFSDNEASAGFNTVGGGGIYNSGSAAVTGSTFTLNSGFLGGGAYNVGALDVTNTTFSGNTSTDGGGVFNEIGGTLTVLNSTFSGNTADWEGGGIFNANGGTLNYANTIIANSIFLNPTIAGVECYCGSGVSTNLNNLVEDGSGATNGVNFRTGDPGLAPLLGNHGGTTQTLALLPGSPAIDTGDNATCAAAPVSGLDQRGVARPAACDIGAFESRGFTLTKTGGDNQSTLVNTNFPNLLTLMVSSPFGEPVDGGWVTFTPPASGASAAITTSPMQISSGSHTVDVIATANGTPGGPYNVVASASGAASVNFSLNNYATTSTTLTSSDNPSILGNSVTFTATVSPAPDGGIVTFKDGVVPIAGCAAQPLTGGQATCDTSALSLGAHVITAQYSGTANYTASTGMLSPDQQVNGYPIVSLSAASHNFGDQLVGTTSGYFTFTVTNTGTADLHVGTLNITTGQFELSDFSCNGTTVAPSGTCTFGVTFSPTSTGAKTGTVSIPSDASTSPDSVTLSGTGVQPALSVDPASHDFGDQLVGTTSGYFTFTVTNTSTVDLHVGTLNITTGEFELSDFSCNGTTVAPSGTCTFGVTFSPTSTGAKTGTVSIPSDASTSPDSVTLSGNGVAPAVGIDPADHNFGYQPTGTTSTPFPFTLTNTGAADLHLGTLDISGEFALGADLCSGQTIAPSNTCTFEVTFTPTSTGVKTGLVSIPSDADTSPDEVSLTGNAPNTTDLRFRSIAGYDGIVRESSETSGVGNFIDSSNPVISIGDDAQKRQQVAILDFDTSTLPANAVITNVRLRVKVSQFPAAIYNKLGKLIADIIKPKFGNGIGLEKADFAFPALFSNVGAFPRATAVNQWITLTMNNSAFTAVNFRGHTQFRLRFTLDDSNDTVAHQLSFASGDNTATADRPMLIITYYVP